MPAGCYLFVPFLWTKVQKLHTKNRSTKKSHENVRQANIIATNFVCEQLNINITALYISLKTRHYAITYDNILEEAFEAGET